MAVQVWKDMTIMIAAYPYAGIGKNIVLSTEVAPLDVTPLSTAGNIELIGGLKTGTVNFEFMSDTNYDGLFESMLGAALPVSICTASADGSAAYLFSHLALSYTPWSGSVGDLSTGQISGTASGSPVVRGKVLHPLVARTASGSGTARQLGSVAAGKSIYAALHVAATAGTSPTLNVKIQSDDNASFTSPTDRITFSTATADTYQFTSTPGAITDTYWRAVWTIGGTNPSFSFLVTAGII